MSVRSSSVPVSKPGLAVGTLRRALLGAVLLVPVSGVVHAYTVTLDPDAPQTIYLQVGVGSFTADYCGGTTYPPTHATPACGPQYGGGTPEKNTTINTVSVTLTTAAVGNKTAQAMTTNSTAGNSFLDGYAFCNVPSQLYVGGFFRTSGANTAAATITATVPAALTRHLRRQHSVFANTVGDQRQRRHRRRAFHRRRLRQRRRADGGHHGQQLLGRKLLDVFLSEHPRAGGRHVHRRRSLHIECAMIAARRPPTFFLALALTIIWCSAAGAKSITIDDSGTTAIGPAVSMRWKTATPSRSGGANLMVGSMTVRVRINVTPWLRHSGRIYLSLPAQQPGPIGLSWITQGRFLAARSSPAVVCWCTPAPLALLSWKTR
jgi:hypothetical protein